VPDLVQLDDVRVVQLFHDIHLTVHLLQVRGVQLRLVDDLDGHLQQKNTVVPLNTRCLPATAYQPHYPSQSIQVVAAPHGISPFPGTHLGTRHPASNVQISSRTVFQNLLSVTVKCFHLEFWLHTTKGTSFLLINPLTPTDDYSGRTAPITFKRCILYIYSTHIGTEYFKHGIYSPFFPLQNAVCFMNLTYLVPVLFTFYIQVC